MDDLLEKIVKVFDEDNELCLVDECPKDLTCGECWKNEIEKFINNIYNKAIDEAVGYIENEWNRNELINAAIFILIVILTRIIRQ